MEQSAIKQIQKCIGYEFSRPSLLEQAFTHSSYAQKYGKEDNERMEFFGDAVLELIVSEYLYANKPSYDQGRMTKVRAALVSADGLRPVVDRMDVLKYLKVADKHANLQQLSKKIEANLFEAILCAVYADGGMSAAKKFVFAHMAEELAQADNIRYKDDKTALQELCQADKTLGTPTYEKVSQSGPQNAPTIVVRLTLGCHTVTAQGQSKKQAEQEAAKKLLEILEKK